MKIKQLTIATIFAFAWSSFAMAGGLFNDEPFSGLYIGGQGGYGHENSQITDTGGDTGEFGNMGPTYGLFGGVGTTLGSMFYLGLEGQYNILNRDSSDFIAGVSYDRESHREWNIGGRLGLVFGENTLVYVRGAYSELGVDIRDSSALPLTVNDLTGFAGGVGAEYAFAHFFTLRAEYVYSNYDKGNIYALTPPIDVADIDTSSSEIRLGLALEF